MEQNKEIILSEAADFRHTMALPEQVIYCMEALRKAGHCCYAVGGCVRDSLLGLQPHDYDLCTDAAPAQICAVFSHHGLVRSGEKHGTIGVVLEGNVYEITTFRTEGGYTDSRHPDWVEFVKDVQGDLARRDFTVNAMAYAPEEGLVDPWNGRKDLKDKRLRTVGDPVARFTEDPLRILRGVRFAVRYGLRPTPETEKAMCDLAPLMDKLARERVLEELCKLLPLVSAGDLVRYAPVILGVIPELAPAVGFDQSSPHHIYDVYTHSAHVVENVPGQLALCWAALLHDIAKPQTYTRDGQGRGHFYGHGEQSAILADSILRRLKAPNALRQQVVLLVENHMQPLQADKKLLRRQVTKLGMENVELLVQLQRADCIGTGVHRAHKYDAIAELLTQIRQENDCLSIKDLAVNGNDLMQAGVTPGPRMGQLLEQLLYQVQSEVVPNEKEALLAQIKKG